MTVKQNDGFFIIFLSDCIRLNWIKDDMQQISKSNWKRAANNLSKTSKLELNELVMNELVH